MVGALGEGLGWLLTAQGASDGGAILRGAGRVAGLLVLLVGVCRWRSYRLVRGVGWAVVGAGVAGSVAWMFLQVEARGAAIATAGIYAMALAFALGLAMIRALFSFGAAWAGIARTVVQEAVRMRVALVLLVGLILLVPVLPVVLDPDERLQYRIQFFLTWAVGGITLLLSFMTVFLACGTICGEVRERRIFTTMTKPVRPAAYLGGKWIGLSALNLVLVAVAGCGIYTFARILEQQPARDQADRRAVAAQVLTARRAVAPEPPDELNVEERFEKRVEKLREQNPGRYDAPLTTSQREQIMQRVLAKWWYTVPPRGERTFVFRGLGPAREAGGGHVQIRFKPKASERPPEGKIWLRFWVNGRKFREAHLADDTMQVMDVPVDRIDEEGALRLRIAHVHPRVERATFPASVTFPPGKDEGMQAFYPVDAFGANLARGLAMSWLRLVFLGVVGLMAGTFLGFPVACLLTLLVLVTGIGSDFVTEALTYYAAWEGDDASGLRQLVAVPGAIAERLVAGEIYPAAKIVVRLLGQAIVALIPSFDAFSASAPVARGRVVSWGQLGNAVLWLGVIWSGACALIAWLVFRARELAKITL